MNMILDYFKEVRDCSCETFQERRNHLWPTFIISTLFFTVYFLFIRGPHYGFTSILFFHELIAGIFPLIGFFAAASLSQYFIVNQILALPTIGCFAASAYNLLTPEYFTADSSLYSHMLVIGIFYGSFISSIRCNLIMNIFGCIMPFLIAMNVNHVEVTHVTQQMAVVVFAGLLGAAFSYRMNVYQREMNALKNNLRNEKLSLENAQTVAKLGNWSFNLHSKEFNWSSQMFSIFPENKNIGEPDYKKHRSTIHPEDVENWDRVIKECIKSGNSFKLQFRTFEKDLKTELWVEARGQTIKDAHGKVIELFGTCQNITDFKHLETQLDQEKHKMIQTAKLATLGEMAAGVAHEINNPSAIIKGHATMLRRKKDKADGDFIEKMVVGIEKSVDRIAKIVNGLRKFSRTTDGEQLTQINVKELFYEVINLTQSKSNKSFVKVECEDVPEDIVFMGDEISVEQVLVNLIGNAIDAQEGRGNAWVKIRYNDGGKFHRLIVMDSGHGIPEALIKNLFDPFFTTKEVGKGTGLGLSISKGIAQEHKGDLTYEIIDGHTAFILTIPKDIPKEGEKEKNQAA